MRNFDVKWGVLSSSPPTACGIATFTTALGDALVRRGDDINLVRILDGTDAVSASPFGVVSELIAGDASSIERAAWALNRCDVALIQHEYGLYGGLDGDDVVTVMRQLQVPVVSVLHTVLSEPTAHQRAVLNDVIELSTCVVVMTSAAEMTLRRRYLVGDVTVRVIPHGAALGVVRATPNLDQNPLLLTWGLIGPGKGIEWVIDAMANLRDLSPRPRYIVAGRTHPKVLVHEGDRYRRFLERRVKDSGVADMVFFDNNYRPLASLNLLIANVALVLLPYDSADQATSGVLVDAIAAGRPVIATSFPHSLEMLSSGAGMVVEHRNPRALSDAIRQIITQPALAEAMASEARRIAPSLSWDCVALRYVDLAREVLHHATLPVSA
ncbi:MAG TPA: glycosyltransferase [Acidimicrobiales bacterium]